MKQLRDVFSGVLNNHYSSQLKNAFIEKLDVDKTAKTFFLKIKSEESISPIEIDSFKAELIKSFNLSNATVEYSEIKEKKEVKHQMLEGFPIYFETRRVLYGKTITKKPRHISQLTMDLGRAVVWGKIFDLEIKESRGGEYYIITFMIFDNTGAYCVKVFDRKNKCKDLSEKLKNDMTVLISGVIKNDRYFSDYVIEANDVSSIEIQQETDDETIKRVELHLHTNMSALDGMADVRDLVARASSYGHKAVAITDHGVTQSFPDAYQAGKDFGIKIIYGLEAYFFDNVVYEDGERKNLTWDECLTKLKSKDIDVKQRTYHQIILVKDEKGLRNLYKLISYSHIYNFYKKPTILRSLLEEHREGLIIGSACEAGELYRAVFDRKMMQKAGKSESEIQKQTDKILKIASFYDYLEIQPIGNNFYMVQNNSLTVDELKDINMEIYEISKDLGLPCVATGDVHFLNKEDSKYRAIIMCGSKFLNYDDQPPLYFKTTTQMLKDFDYLGKDIAYEVVVENTQKISDMVKNIKPIPDGSYTPVIEGAEEELKNLCYKNAKNWYGEDLPEYVKNRLDKELKSIIKNGFAVLYIIANKLVKNSEEHGYYVASRGSVGSSFVATVAEISEVNPLAPHYRCPNCKHSEFFLKGEVGSGYDLPKKNCPICNTPMKRDGQDIPFETFLGFNGEKAPDIDLNFSGEYQERAHQYTIELFGKKHVFKAGTIGTIQSKIAYGYVMKYLEQKNINCNKAEIQRLVNGCTGIKKTTGQHPGGMVIVPSDYEIFDFTPVQYPADDKNKEMMTTHFDYHKLEGTILKLDNLGHDVPTMYKHLEDMTGLSVMEIDISDPKIMDMFATSEAIGVKPEDIDCDTALLTIPEFQTPFVTGMLKEAKPKTFADLLQISGLSHGTDVWNNNARELIKDKVCTISEVIGTRDSIMLYLMEKGVDSALAFKIMEIVRKGKAEKKLTEEMVNEMKKHNVPDWYIDSCYKIKYMFPKAHAAAYVSASLRLCWFKLYRPLEYYAVYLTVKGGDMDAELFNLSVDELKLRMKNMKLANAYDQSKKEKDEYLAMQVLVEMKLRGIEFLNIDLYKSDSTVYLVEDGKIRPALCSVKGLGVKAAQTVVKARKESSFSSQEDLKQRGKLSESVISVLTKIGTLDGVPATDQISFFDI
ncbi:MAG: PolC-type DNA polymerase III [Clostridia bacterium]|nr:PolC-type DNA polymerase III [Clostridia bacterium]